MNKNMELRVIVIITYEKRYVEIVLCVFQSENQVY